MLKMSSNGFAFCSGPGVGLGERMFSEKRVRMAGTAWVEVSEGMLECLLLTRWGGQAEEAGEEGGWREESRYGQVRVGCGTVQEVALLVEHSHEID